MLPRVKAAGAGSGDTAPVYPSLRTIAVNSSSSSASRRAPGVFEVPTPASAAAAAVAAEGAAEGAIGPSRPTPLPRAARSLSRAYASTLARIASTCRPAS